MPLTLSSEALNNAVQKFYDKTYRDLCQDLTESVVDASNLSATSWFLNELSIPFNLKLSEKIILGVLQWYMPKELRCLINLWLEENWGSEFRDVKAVLIHSKKTALGYCLISDRWNDRDFFGNILSKNNGYKSFVRIKLKRKKRQKPKRVVRRRGYNDKGFRSPEHKSVGYYHEKLRSVTEQILLEEQVKLQTEHLFEEINKRYFAEDRRIVLVSDDGILDF